MRRWLARLSFALLVLAFVLAWEAYRAATRQAQGGNGRVTLLAAGAALLFGMGMAGVRERHRHPD